MKNKLKRYDTHNASTRDFDEILLRLERYDNQFPNRQHFFKSDNNGHYVVYLEN